MVLLMILDLSSPGGSRSEITTDARSRPSLSVGAIFHPDIAVAASGRDVPRDDGSVRTATVWLPLPVWLVT